MRDLREMEIDDFLAQAEKLGQLMVHPAWDGWVTLLRGLRQAALEELARCVDSGDFRYWQGVAGALGELLERPERIVTTAADYQRDEEGKKGVIRPDLRAAIGLGVDRDGDI